jgi:hypothetical protein
MNQMFRRAFMFPPLLLLGCAFYGNADSRAGPPLMGLQCVTSRQVALPKIQWQIPIRPSPPGSSASYVTLAAGTKLRVVHFESCREYAVFIADLPRINVQAQVEGWLGGNSVCCWNESEGLSTAAGQAIQAARPQDAAMIVHEVGTRAGN